MPRSFRILQKCTRHNISGELIKSLHFNDLYFLVITLDIQELEQHLNNAKKENQKKKGYDVKEVDAASTIKMLKGGNG